LDVFLPTCSQNLALSGIFVIHFITTHFPN
jgi:hypothetical protein